ncbi:tetratricopeptide repeat protein, partial [bacterium]|nr:tetratricopeptide repeat protein [bacterium]
PAAETALYFLGRTDIATGQVDSGISRLQDFITGKTDHPYLQPATYWLAEGYYRIKDFTRAQHYYREALMLKPNSHYFIPIHQNLGYCALHLHEYPPAQYHFQQMLLTKTDTQTRQLAEIRFADTIFCQNKFNEAIKLYRKFLTENTASPLVPYARLQLGNTYRGMKLHETAYRQYQQLLTEFPQSSLSDQARYQLAQSNFSLNEFDQATRDFLKIPELYPFSDLADDAVYGAANSCFNGRQYADARKNYEKILQEYPESSLRESALDGLRFTLIKLGRVNEAMRLITAADSVEARFQRARLFVDMKKYNSAISEFNQIVKNDSSSTTAQKTYYHIGQTRQLQKKSDLALNAWEQQVSHYPEAAETPLAIEQLGNYFQGRKQYGRAATYYQKLIDNYPEHPVSWKSGIKLGEIAIMEQDTSLALNSWQSVVAHSSGHVENSQARVEIAKILIAQTRTEAARDMLLPPAESAQNSTAAEAQYLIGESLYADARYPAATAAFLKVKYHYPFLEKWCVQSIFRASEALEEMEEYDEARRFYQEIISNYKDGGYRAKAKRKIQYLKKYEDKNAKK